MAHSIGPCSVGHMSANQKFQYSPVDSKEHLRRNSNALSTQSYSERTGSSQSDLQNMHNNCLANGSGICTRTADNMLTTEEPSPKLSSLQSTLPSLTPKPREHLSESSLKTAQPSREKQSLSSLTQRKTYASAPETPELQSDYLPNSSQMPPRPIFTRKPQGTTGKCKQNIPYELQNGDGSKSQLSMLPLRQASLLPTSPSSCAPPRHNPVASEPLKETEEYLEPRKVQNQIRDQIPKSKSNTIPPLPPKPQQENLPPLPPKPQQENLPPLPPKPHQENLPPLPPKPQENLPPLPPKPQENLPPKPQENLPPLPPKPQENLPPLPPKPQENLPPLPPKPQENLPQLPPKPQQANPPPLPPKPQQEDLSPLSPNPPQENFTQRPPNLRNLTRPPVPPIPLEEDQIQQCLLNDASPPTPGPSLSESEIASPTTPLINKVLLPYKHSTSGSSDYSHRQPHFLLRRPSLITASLLSFLLSLGSISLLALIIINPFSYTWQSRTFREGEFKTCVKCVYLMRSITDDNPDLHKLISELRDNDFFCCASTNSQMSELLQLMIKQMEYKPSVNPQIENHVVPYAHKELSFPVGKSGSIALPKQSIMSIKPENNAHFANQSVLLKNNLLKIQVSGWYYVYSHIYYNRYCNKTSENKTMEHHIGFFSHSRDKMGSLVKTSHTCCSDCSDGDKESSFAGGIFELFAGDDICASVTNIADVNFNDKPYLGLMMFGK